jgi:hypothetical protein
MYIRIPFDVKRAPTVGLEAMDLCPTLLPAAFQLFEDGQPELGEC